MFAAALLVALPLALACTVMAALAVAVEAENTADASNKPRFFL